MIVFEIIGIACFTAIVAELSGIMDKVKYWLGRSNQAEFEGYDYTGPFGEKGVRIKLNQNKTPMKRLKPFDCPLCLAYWTGLVYFLLNGYDWQAVVFAPFICSVLAIGIVKLIKGRGI